MTDKMFDALADGRRRQLLLDLLDHNPQPVPKGSDVPGVIAERDRELILKKHVHLPKLADYGFIKWDQEADVVTKGPRFEELRPLLEFLNASPADSAGISS